MRGLAELCIRRPVLASMLILSLVVVGVASYLNLAVDRFPAVDLPTVSVRTSLPGASTEEVEVLVSDPIEEAVNTVEGIDQLRSISVAGASIVVVTFRLERDIDAAAQDVRDRVSAVLPQLPEDAEPPVVAKFDNDQTPVITVAVTGERSLRELTEIADKQVKRRLERSTGVGEVRIVGGLERAINLWLDPQRLAAFGIPVGAVAAAVARQNAEIPGGNVTGAEREQTLRVMGRMRDPRDFEDLVLESVDGVPVRLRDLARVEDGTKEVRSVALLNGVPTVILEVRRQSGANTVAVIDGVKEKLHDLAAQLPPDVRLEVIRDQSRYIHAALHEINLHLVLGSALACLVVLAFMRSGRSTLIAGVAIPTSLVASFGAMWALGFTLNSVTMLALVLMVGVVIDDAIVVLENVFRHMEEKGASAFDAAREGTAEIALAVLATTFSLAVIFIPVSFMSSVSGRFLYQFGITAAVAVLVSLLVSFTLTPSMAARLLRVRSTAAVAGGGGGGDGGGDGGDGGGGRAAVPRSRRGLYAGIERGVQALLGLALRARALVALLAIGLIAAAVPLYRQVPQEYIPSDVDEAEFDVNVNGPEGASLAAMAEVMRAVEAELRAVPEVTLVQASAGGGFLGGVNSGSAYVRVLPIGARERRQRDIMMDVRRRLARWPDLRCSVRNAPSFNIGGGNFEIDFAILGPELEPLSRYAEELRRRAQEAGGIVDADTTLKLDKPELRAVIDRDRAAQLDVQAADVAAALRLMVGGDDEVSRYRDPAVNEEYDVELRLDARWRDQPSDLEQLYVASGSGELVRLDNLVRLEPATTASRVDRLDRQRQVSLRAQVGPGFALADRLEALRGAVAGMNLPAAYSTYVAGRGRELERTFGEFLWAFLLSVVLMYIILAAQFESLVHPLTILLSLPLSVPFALLSLWLSGNTLNLYSALGILVLFGVVKKNAILQIDHANQLRAAGMPRTAAILQANRDRLRPILMTTLTLVAGMLPLALGAGPGAEERRTIAVVVIGGQMLALVVTLIVTPVAYSLFDDLGGLFRGRKAATGRLS
ncbi:MAG: efflux RND transporter permease subunit [Planctomycetota bacterium]|nr:MAG: efflux RND transporter permease subunit [Planctomycetota bacterium]